MAASWLSACVLLAHSAMQAEGRVLAQQHPSAARPEQAVLTSWLAQARCKRIC